MTTHSRAHPSCFFLVVNRDQHNHRDYGHSHIIDNDEGDGYERAERLAVQMCELDYEAAILRIRSPRKGWRDFRNNNPDEDEPSTERPSKPSAPHPRTEPAPAPESSKAGRPTTKGHTDN